MHIICVYIYIDIYIYIYIHTSVPLYTGRMIRFPILKSTKRVQMQWPSSSLDVLGPGHPQIGPFRVTGFEGNIHGRDIHYMRLGVEASCQDLEWGAPGVKGLFFGKPEKLFFVFFFGAYLGTQRTPRLFFGV